MIIFKLQWVEQESTQEVMAMCELDGQLMKKGAIYVEGVGRLVFDREIEAKLESWEELDWRVTRNQIGTTSS